MSLYTVDKIELIASDFVNTIAKIDVDDVWMDDHIDCCRVTVEVVDGRSTKLEFWWIGCEGVGAFTYFNTSTLARTDTKSAFTNLICMSLDEVLSWLEGEGEDAMKENCKDELAVLDFIGVKYDDHVDF